MADEQKPRILPWQSIAARAATGETQKELAARLGAARGVVVRFEKGGTVKPVFKTALAADFAAKGVTITVEEDGDDIISTVSLRQPRAEALRHRVVEDDSDEA